MAETVHPHGCGENLRQQWMGVRAIGSSPRVWGKLPHGNRGISRLRFIPTGVGKTAGPGAGRRGTSVHPHGCGENSIAGAHGIIPGGSSPRVWGKLRQACAHFRGIRFIPTGVGNTKAAMFVGRAAAGHPHGCGENIQGVNKRAFAARFIPTGVGKT